jgi:hypothetical protein
MPDPPLRRLGEFAFLMNWNDNSDNGGAPRDPSVLLSSGGNTNKLHMTRVDKGNTYYVSVRDPSPRNSLGPRLPV